MNEVHWQAASRKKGAKKEVTRRCRPWTRVPSVRPQRPHSPTWRGSPFPGDFPGPEFPSVAPCIHNANKYNLFRYSPCVPTAREVRTPIWVADNSWPLLQPSQVAPVNSDRILDSLYRILLSISFLPTFRFFPINFPQMSSTPSDTTRKKVLALRADRLQKEIELMKTKEDLALLEEDSLTVEPSPPSLPTSSNASSSFGSFPSLDETQILSDKMIGSGITKDYAQSRIAFYENDMQNAKNSTGPDRESWMARTRVKILKHRESVAFESAVITDCIKRLSSLSAPTTNPGNPADHSFFAPIGHKPLYDGHSG
jgi:hypothetical protein